MAKRKMNNIFNHYTTSPTSFKLSKSRDQAESSYINVAECHLKVESKHDAALAYVDAANCCKKTSPMQAISYLDQAVILFSSIGKFGMAAKYCQQIGDMNEKLRNFEEAIMYFKQAVGYFQDEEATTLTIKCKEKVAQFYAHMHQYTKAIDIYEALAREAVDSNLLRYGVRGHLLNAGICHFCNADLMDVTKALERYQDLDFTFSRTREYILLNDLVAAYDKEDVEEFTEVLTDYDSLTPLDPWRKIMLMRVKVALKAKELNDDR